MVILATPLVCPRGLYALPMYINHIDAYLIAVFYPDNEYQIQFKGKTYFRLISFMETPPLVININVHI